MQYDRGLLLHERPRPHPLQIRGKNAGASTAVRRSRAGQRGQSNKARPTFAEKRANPSKRHRPLEAGEAGPEAHPLLAQDAKTPQRPVGEDPLVEASYHAAAALGLLRRLAGYCPG